MKKGRIFALVLVWMLCVFSTFNNVLSQEKVVTLPAGTMIIIRIDERITSETPPGTIVKASVLHDVIVEGYTVIKSGTPVHMTVASAEKAKMVGREGKLTLEVYSTKAVDGQEILLRGSLAQTGEERLVTSLAISYFICPLALMMKGGEAEIPVGTEIRAYVANNTKIKVPINK